MKAGQESRGRGQDKMERERVGKEMDEARSSSQDNRNAVASVKLHLRS